MPNSADYRYRSALWAVNDASLTTFAMILIALIALISIGLAKHRIQDGFNGTFMLFTPDTVHMTVATLHSFEASFLLRFIPVLLMNLSGCIWDMADMFYRITEPFATMNEPGPATGNILLDYPSAPAGLITIKAMTNGHWRVALCSTFSLLATIPPIVATGIFVGSPIPNGIAVSIAPINFWIFFILLIIYLIFMIVLRPTPSYRLPRVVRNLCDVLGYCYASGFLDDLGPDGKPIFSAQERDDQKVHLESKIHLAKKDYQFGLYFGKDGKRHMGFDVAVRDSLGGKQVEVENFDPGWGIRGLGMWSLWRKPKLLRSTF